MTINPAIPGTGRDGTQPHPASEHGEHGEHGEMPGFPSSAACDEEEVDVLYRRGRARRRRENGC